MGPKIEKHKNTQNTNNTFGHSQTYNEPHMDYSDRSEVPEFKSRCKRMGDKKVNSVMKMIHLQLTIEH